MLCERWGDVFLRLTADGAGLRLVVTEFTDGRLPAPVRPEPMTVTRGVGREATGWRTPRCVGGAPTPERRSVRTLEGAEREAEGLDAWGRVRVTDRGRVTVGLEDVARDPACSRIRVGDPVRTAPLPRWIRSLLPPRASRLVIVRRSRFVVAFLSLSV